MSLCCAESGTLWRLTPLDAAGVVFSGHGGRWCVRSAVGGGRAEVKGGGRDERRTARSHLYRAFEPREERITRSRARGAFQVFRPENSIFGPAGPTVRDP